MKWIFALVIPAILLATSAYPRTTEKQSVNLKHIEWNGEKTSPPNSDRADTLFLFAASGEGAFGMPGTDDRGYTFDNLDPWGPAPAGWTSVDATAQDGLFWHLADAHITDGHATDISEALPFNYPEDPVNDFALWCGLDSVCGWINPRGYGNKWDQYLRISSVDFNDSLLVAFTYTGFHEGLRYDYFQVLLEVINDSHTSTEEIFRNTWPGEGIFREYEFWISASDFPDADAFGDVILRFSSDYSWSDEDNMFPTDIGAVWIDNIIIRADGVDVLRTDLESGVLPAGISPEIPPGAGNYGELYAFLYAEDQCIVNNTHAWAFFDWEGPTENPEYPIPVVAYGPPYIDNIVWSPVLEIAHELGDPVGQPPDGRIEHANQFVLLDLLGSTHKSLSRGQLVGACANRGDAVSWHCTERKWRNILGYQAMGSL